jgi:hypothetical protein
MWGGSAVLPCVVKSWSRVLLLAGPQLAKVEGRSMFGGGVLAAAR